MSTPYVSTAEHAKQIRTQLKTKLGLTQKDVSVRAHSYSMGASIYVKVKSARAKMADVRKIAMAHEQVRRCDRTGETLSGGNTYIHVDFDHAFIEAEAAKYVAMMADMVVGDFKVISLVSITRTGSSIWLLSAKWLYRGTPSRLFSAEQAANALAAAILDAPDAAKPANEVAA